MLLVNQLTGFSVPPPGAVAAITAAFTDSQGNSANLSTYTFSGMSFGAADAGRIMIVAVGAGIQSGVSVSGVTVGGQTATSRIAVKDDNAACAEIWTAAVPTGTSGSVVVTMTGGNSRNCSVGLYRMVGAASATPTDTGSDVDSSPSVSMTVPTGGYLVGSLFESIETGAPTWTNATRDYYDDTLDNESTASSAHNDSAGTYSVSTDSSSNSTALVCAAWGP